MERKTGLGVRHSWSWGSKLKPSNMQCTAYSGICRVQKYEEYSVLGDGICLEIK